MYNRNDPRLRQRLNELSQTLESANESAQANIFTFTQRYIQPCFSGVVECFRPCVERCFPPRDQRGRARSRRGLQGRAELNFDFYDDWDEDDNDALSGWGTDEREGLLAGAGGLNNRAGPAYGTNAPRQLGDSGLRDAPGGRKSNGSLYDDDAEPTVIPAAPYFGFFGKLANVLGGPKKLQYKPSAADLQDHPGGRTKLDMLAEESVRDAITERRGAQSGRHRSATTSSGHTTDSLSSRGDIFPSDDEDDAVALDDEFAMVLERRTTNSARDDSSGSGRPGRSKKRPSASSRGSQQSMQSASTASVREGVSGPSSRQAPDCLSVPGTPGSETSGRSTTEAGRFQRDVDEGYDTVVPDQGTVGTTAVTQLEPLDSYARTDDAAKPSLDRPQ